MVLSGLQLQQEHLHQQTYKTYIQFTFKNFHHYEAKR
jgi:hypothetical protein